MTEIEGSTRNWEAGEAAMRAALARHDAILSGTSVAGRGRAAKAFRLAGAATAWAEGERMAVEYAVALDRN